MVEVVVVVVVVVVVEVWGGVRLWPVVCRPSIPIGRYCYCHRGGFKKKGFIRPRRVRR